MKKTIYIKEDNLFNIKRLMASEQTSHKPFIANNKPPYEKDKYEIGGEGNNNDFFHINENRLQYIDLSTVGLVEYEWYFDEDEYLEWLQDNELSDSEETRNTYYREEVTYGVEYFDNETFHYMESDQNLLFDELIKLFGKNMAEKMLKQCIENGGGKFETYELYEDNSYDLNSHDEVNNIAMKLFTHGEYYKNCRGFILTNGIVVYTPNEHNEICMIPGVKSKFDFIEMGNIRVLPNSIDIGAEPTYEQEEVLRQVISSYSEEELYLDIFDNGEEIGAKYITPDWRYVIGEIDRYYSEGIKPQGNNGLYESEDINDLAKKVQTGGESKYILTDGSIIAFKDHKFISKIKGMTPGKFLNIGNIRLGYLGGIELSKRPTNKQIPHLKKHILEHDGNVFLEITKYVENRFYASTVCGAEYRKANPNRVINDIFNYFDNGIKPQGNNWLYENKVIEEDNTFESWFGGSILKDENGQPIKMYHGTDAVFNEFSKEHIGGHGSYEGYGFNFTPYESRAIGYSSKNVIEAYLRVESPMTTKSNKITLQQLVKIMAELDEGKPFTDTVVAAYEPAGYGEEWNEKYYRRALPVAARTIYNYNKENEYGDAGIYAELCLNGNADKIKTIEVFEKLGYDSAIFYDNYGRLNTVVVFGPNQIKRTTNKTFINDSNVMNENIETEVESNEVKLDSFKKNDTLADRIWDGMKLNPRVRLKLLDIADDFWDFANINWIKRKGIYLTGSICNYNWSNYSDIDLHVIVDFSEIDERKDFVQEYFNAKKNEWNEEHNKLKIYGYPVEIYVEDINENTISGGIFDLEQNKWIKTPDKNNIKDIGLEKYEIKNKTAKIMTTIDNLYDELNSTDDDAQLREIGKKAHKLLNKIKRMRKFGLTRNGEMDAFNVMFKILRRTEYLEKLWNLNAELYDKVNSLGLEENTIKFIAEKYIKYHIKNINEEIVADGNAQHNPFKERWRHEREVLKNYVATYGELMTSKENGKQYRCLYDETLSQRLGFNYCICLQWDPLTMEPGNILYVRAYDKFTKRLFRPKFDDRGYDNIQGTADDVTSY